MKQSAKNFLNMEEGEYVEPGHDVNDPVEWLASPEAGMKLPAEFLDPVARVIRLAREQKAAMEKARTAIEKARRCPDPDGMQQFLDEALSWL